MEHNHKKKKRKEEKGINRLNYKNSQSSPFLLSFSDKVTWLVIYLLTASDHYGTVNACDSFVGNEKVWHKYRICKASLLQILIIIIILNNKYTNVNDGKKT